MVERPGNVGGDFNVLYLITPDRHHVRFHDEDVHGHQHRVVVQPHVDACVKVGIS
jgi:hypothetical protein